MGIATSFTPRWTSRQRPLFTAPQCDALATRRRRTAGCAGRPPRHAQDREGAIVRQLDPPSMHPVAPLPPRLPPPSLTALVHSEPLNGMRTNLKKFEKFFCAGQSGVDSEDHVREHML
jgi:hypothetical protein